MKPSTLRILSGSATVALLAVGPGAIADAYAAPNAPQEAAPAPAPGGDPCKGDPNCSSGGATAPSGGAYQGSQPSNGGGQTATPPPGQPGAGQPGSPPPNNGQAGGG